MDRGAVGIVVVSERRGPAAGLKVRVATNRAGELVVRTRTRFAVNGRGASSTDGAGQVEEDRLESRSSVLIG